MARTWNALIHSLICVRLGQELGTSSELAQGLAGAIDWLLSIAARFCS